jgi:phospholipid transport system substrate-binding protein
VSPPVQEETRRLPWREPLEGSWDGWFRSHFRRGRLLVILEGLAAFMYGIAVHTAAWIVLLCTAALAASPDVSESPTEAVRATVSQIMRILEDPALKDPAKVMPRRRMLEEVIATRFDYAEMSKRALAAYWVPLTAAERAEFVEVFKKFLSDRYAEKIEGYSGQQVVYLSERIEGSYAEVRSELRSEKTTIPLDYRLLLKEGRWYAYDLIADGISLVKNYRSQFQQVIRDSSYQELVKKLRERSLSGETKTTP